MGERILTAGEPGSLVGAVMARAGGDGRLTGEGSDSDRRAVTDQTMTGTARRPGDRVRAEDGVATAVDLLEQAVPGRR